LNRAIIALLYASYCFFPASGQELTFETPLKLPQGINSDVEESMPIISPDGSTLYYTRNFYNENIGGEEAGQDIWFSISGEKGKWKNASNNLNGLNNKWDNAIIGINEDAKTYYLLGNYKSSSKIGVSSTIYQNKIWSTPEAIEIKGLKSKSGLYGFYMHSKGEILLISMDGTGSEGKEDIYVSLLNEEGQWSEPINLGGVINTEEYEITPCLDHSGINLYFSSQGHGGLGDADVFVSKRLDDTWTNWSKPVNLGEPINSLGFDASFSINKAGDVFFVSNRSGVLSDIFYTKVKIEEEPSEEITVMESTEDSAIVDSAISTAQIILQTSDTSNQVVAEETLVVDEQEEVAIDTSLSSADTTQIPKEERRDEIAAVPENDSSNTNVEAIVQATVIDSNINEVTAEEVVTASIESSPSSEENELEEEEPEEPEENIVKTVEKSTEPIKPEPFVGKHGDDKIYFDHNSSYLRSEAKAELRKLAEKFKQQEGLKAEIAGFADMSGKDHYNLWITQRRSNRVRDYIAEQGVDASRLTAKWYGEANLAVNCGECSEEDNQMNRRVEIIFR